MEGKLEGGSVLEQRVLAIFIPASVSKLLPFCSSLRWISLVMFFALTSSNSFVRHFISQTLDLNYH